MVPASGNELCSGEGIVVEESGEAEETRAPVIGSRPNAPTKAELKAHLPLHVNCRSWCPYYVSGKGHNKHHRVSTDEPVDKHVGWTTWHMDYCFLNKKTLDEHDPSDVQVDGSIVVLITYD